MSRILSYAKALREATEYEMNRDSSVIVMGIGADDFKGIYGTTQGLVEKFGNGRVFDTPLAEDSMTGIAIGAALGGLKPIHIHIRMDFALLAMNQIINMAAKMNFMYGGQVQAPLVIRLIIGRSWGQGAQHSQGLHSYFMHVPGLKVVAPSTPFHAKGCLLESIRDPHPVIFIEHMLLHKQTGEVPQEAYTFPFGKSDLAIEGSDVTLVGISWMAVECKRAATLLKEKGISAEVIDPVSLSPLDFETILKSARKTKRVLVVDSAWTNCGASAEILARISESSSANAIQCSRLGFASTNCPPSPTLEAEFYPDAQKISARAFQMMYPDKKPWKPENPQPLEAAPF